MSLQTIYKNISTNYVEQVDKEQGEKFVPSDDKGINSSTVVIRVPTKELVEVAITSALKCGQYNLQIVVESDLTLINNLTLINTNLNSRLKSLEYIVEKEHEKNIDSRLKSLEYIVEKEHEKDIDSLIESLESIVKKEKDKDSRLKSLESRVEKEHNKKDINEQYRDVYERNRIEYETYCNMLEYEKAEYEREMINVLSKEKNKYRYEKTEYERKEKIEYDYDMEVILNDSSYGHYKFKKINKKDLIKMNHDRNMGELNFLDYEQNECIRIKYNNNMEEQNRINYKKKESAIGSFNLISNSSYLDNKIYRSVKGEYIASTDVKENEELIIKTYDIHMEEKKNIEEDIIKSNNLKKDKCDIDLERSNDYLIKMFEKRKEYNSAKYDDIIKIFERVGKNGEIDRVNESLAEYKIEYERMEQNIAKHKENIQKLNTEEYEKNKNNIIWVNEQNEWCNKVYFNNRENDKKLALQCINKSSKKSHTKNFFYNFQTHVLTPTKQGRP
jgi:hypothetical protein